MDRITTTQLSGELNGAILVDGDADYAAARKVWNGTIDKRPEVIVQCATIKDVVAAVSFAREQGLGISVRGGGHHVAGSSILDGGLVVDLSQMRAVSVDPSTKRVRADGGAQIGDVDAASQEHRLAVPTGLMSETGIGGLTLAGGFGWLRRLHGPSCDSLVGADVVNADGNLVHANAQENADLFWALRGGGWDVGVVVSFEFQAYPLGPEVFFAFTAYPFDQGKQVLQGFRDAIAKAPPAAAPIAVGWTFGEEPYPQEVWGKQFVGVAGPYAGPVEEGEKAMQPFRELGTPLLDMSGPMPWLDVEHLFDEEYPKGRRYYWKSSYLRELSDPAIDMLLELTASRPSPLTSIDVWPMGGAVAGVGLDQSPLGHRDAPYIIGVESNWNDPAEDSANIAFARDAIEKLRPFSTGGSYMNFEDPDDPNATAASYGPALERLRSVKQKYDPDNLFRSRRGLGG